MPSPWTATLISATRERGNVVAAVRFDNAETKESFTEILRGSDLTQARVEQFAWVKIAALDACDSAIAGLAVGPITPTPPGLPGG